MRIQQGLCKIISRAKLKESGESCVRWGLESLLNISLCKIDSLAIFKVNAEMLDGRMALVDRKGKNAPHSLISTDVSPTFVAGNLIKFGTNPFKSKDCLVTPLVDIFANVFDGFDRVAKLNVDMCVEYF